MKGSSSSRPPEAFLCPICRHIMSDPVITPSGQSFDRHCITASILHPPSPSSFSSSSSSSSLSISQLTSNDNLRSAILHYCDSLHIPHPLPVDPPPPPSSPHHPSVPNSPKLPISPSSTSTPFHTQNPEIFSSMEDEIVGKLRSFHLSEQEEALQLLRIETRERPEQRTRLCKPSLLSSLLPHLDSPNPSFRSTATASLVNLSLDPLNRVAILLSGAAPKLVESLRSPDPEIRSCAAAALFSLSMERANRGPIAALGAVPALLELLYNSAEDAHTRRDAAMALYQLSTSTSNVVAKKLATVGVARALLGLAKEHEVDSLRMAVLMVVLGLALLEEGRAALLEAGAVEAVVGIVRKGKGEARRVELCLKVLHGLSKGGWMFWGKARRVGVKELLEEVWTNEVETGMEKAADMARKLLLAMSRGGGGGEGGGGNGDERECVSGPVAGERRRSREMGERARSNRY